MRKLIILTAFLLALPAMAQYGRMDFSLQNAQGQAIAGATVTVQTQAACGTPTTGNLATLYPAATGGTPLTQPLITDGFGHAFAYASSGCYTYVYNSPYTGTLTYVDQVISTPTSGSGIVTPSPQFSLFYQPNSGTVGVAQGDPNITTDGSGNQHTVSLTLGAGANLATGLQAPTANAAVNLVEVLALGALCDGIHDDRAAFKAAFAAATPNGTVVTPIGKTCVISSKDPSATLALPFDDGTFIGGSTCGGGTCTTLSAENAYTIPIQLVIPNGVRLRCGGGDNWGAGTIKGAWDGSTVPAYTGTLATDQAALNNAATPILFQASGNNTIQGCDFTNTFIALAGPNIYNGYALGEFDYLRWGNAVGFAWISNFLDSVKFHHLWFNNAHAGIISGGWYGQRNTGFDGGYTQKVQLRDVRVQGPSNSLGSVDNAVDAFFDNYLWKSRNSPGCNYNTHGPVSATFSITSNVVSVVGTGFPAYNAGQNVILSGFSVATYLNGVQVQILTSSPTTYTFAFTHANVGSTADATGIATGASTSTCATPGVDPSTGTYTGRMVDQCQFGSTCMTPTQVFRGVSGSWIDMLNRNSAFGNNQDVVQDFWSLAGSRWDAQLFAYGGSLFKNYVKENSNGHGASNDPYNAGVLEAALRITSQTYNSNCQSMDASFATWAPVPYQLQIPAQIDQYFDGTSGSGSWPNMFFGDACVAYQELAGTSQNNWPRTYVPQEREWVDYVNDANVSTGFSTHRTIINAYPTSSAAHGAVDYWVSNNSSVVPAFFGWQRGGMLDASGHYGFEWGTCTIPYCAGTTSATPKFRMDERGFFFGAPASQTAITGSVGTGGLVQETTSASKTSGNLVKWDANGNTVDAGTGAPISGTTGSIGGGALLVNACASGTATVTGLTTGMALAVTPVADPNTPGTQNYDWYAVRTGSNTATVYVCATVAGTPAATTYNVRAIQ